MPIIKKTIIYRLVSQLALCHNFVACNLSSKNTRPRDMLLLLKDTLFINNEKLLKACRSVCSPVPQSNLQERYPHQKCEISTLFHYFIIDYCRDFSLICIYVLSQD